MSQIPGPVIEAVKDAMPIERVLTEIYGKEINNDKKTVCDFHKDDSPSLHIFEDGGYKCFSCGAGKKGQELTLPDGSKIIDAGNSVFGYVQNREGVSFPEAVRFLGFHAGVYVPDTRPDPEIEKILTQTTDYNRQFYAALQQDPDAIQYLKDRGLDESDFQKWRLGMVPWNWSQKRYAGRIVFGMTEMYNEPELAKTIAMAYRVRNYEDYLKHGWLPDELKEHMNAKLNEDGSVKSLNPKFYNDAKSKAYDKSSFLYGMTYAHKALRPRPREERFIVVMEGYMDVIMGHKQGLDTSVACCGTSLTDNHADLISRNAKKVFLWFDGDEAGRNAAMKALPKLLARGCEVLIVESNGQDPAELALAGHNLAEYIFKNSKPAVQMVINQEVEEFDRLVSEQRTKVIRNLLPLLNSIEDPAAKINYRSVIEGRLGITI